MNLASDKTPFSRFWSKVFLLSLLASLVVCATSQASTADPKATAILKKARDYIGRESDLRKIKSIRYFGKITNEEGDEGTVEIYIRAPYQQLQIVTLNETVSEFGLDDYVAWRKVYLAGKPDNYQLYPATAEQLKRTRANAFENLNFFSTETTYTRKIDYLGTDTFEGKQVEKVKIRYGKVFFIRYFDSSTGELLYSEIENGEGIKERGEMIVDGIRFPKGVANFLNGDQVSFVEFELIEVNPEVDDSLFAQPALPGLKKK